MSLFFFFFAHRDSPRLGLLVIRVREGSLADSRLAASQISKSPRMVYIIPAVMTTDRRDSPFMAQDLY